MRATAVALACILAITLEAQSAPEQRPRARDIGVVVGVLPAGPHNAITDVAGVKVGHATLIKGDNVRTGVTAILPHDGNLFQEKVPGAIVAGNGFGKLLGSTQVKELGEIETPILLTSTLNVPRVADALMDWMLALPGNENVPSINPVVGETNDGQLNDIRGHDRCWTQWEQGRGVAVGSDGGSAEAVQRTQQTMTAPAPACALAALRSLSAMAPSS